MLYIYFLFGMLYMRYAHVGFHKHRNKSVNIGLVLLPAIVLWHGFCCGFIYILFMDSSQIIQSK